MFTTIGKHVYAGTRLVSIANTAAAAEQLAGQLNADAQSQPVTVEPTRIDQKVRHVETGRIGTTVRVVGIQDSRVFVSPKRLFTVQWDDTGSKQDVWSDHLETSAEPAGNGNVEVVYEGHACPDCSDIIANDEWSGIESPELHGEKIAHVGLGKLGHVVMACPEDCEGYFSTSGCDYCGSTLDGMRHPIAVLATVADRLEQLRAAIRAENISYGELAELQSLAAHIDRGDVELLEWAGVPESEVE